jgi:hypothetical protein
MPSIRRVCVLVSSLSGLIPAAAAAQVGPPDFKPLSHAVLLDVGATMGTLQGSNSSHVSWAPGFLAGVSFTPKGNAVTWQLGGVVHQYRARIGEFTVRTLRLEAPFLLRANFRADRRLRFHILAGPSLGLKLRSSVKSASGIGDLSNTTPLVEYSVVIGIGVDVGQVTAGVRFHQGLNVTRLLVEDQQTRSRALVVVLGYRLE